MINPTIFREYDIRGLISEADQLSPEVRYLLGRGIGTFLSRRGINRVVVGRDAREYSQAVEDDVIKGFKESGMQVYRIGEVLTPIFYFSQHHLKIRGGVMITASHNPNGWSGMKVANDFSTTLLPQEIQELRRIIENEDFISANGEEEEVAGIIEAYTAEIVSRVPLQRSFTTVVDAGNGGAGRIVPDVFRRAGCRVIERHCDIDSSFPNHIPNPSNVEAAEDLAKGTREANADVGFGFDDDGDRLGFADEKGKIIWPDKALILLARAVLQKYPGAPIVFDVKSTQALFEDIQAQGGIPVMWKTGHSYIKQKAKEVDAPLAGERSGHIFYRKDYYGFDDAMFAALKFLAYLEEDGRTVSEIFKTIPQYITSPVWEPECSDEKKYHVVEEITRQFKKEYGEGRVIEVNGARVNFGDGWGLIRASSNLPRLVLVFESKTEKGLQKIEAIFRERLKQFPEVSEIWHTG